MGKKVLIGIAVVVLILVVVIWQVAANLDNIVAGVVEDVGSDVLKTEVRVSGMSVSLKEGKVGIAGLTIANPDGFSSANLFEMEGIEVDLALDSLGKDVLVIESVLIQNPKISYEENAGGGNNMQTLLDNMESDVSEESTSAEGEEIKIIIDRFEFTGGQVTLDSAVLPEGVSEIKLPAVKMSSIGGKKGGVPASVAAEKIVKELVNEIIKAAAKAGINKAIEEKKKGFLDKLTGKG